MTATASLVPPSDIRTSRPVELTCFALCVANVVFVVASYATGNFLVGPDGHGIPTDFVNVWAAGRLVLDGHAAAVYDWGVHKQVEVAAVGHPFNGYYAWYYPPPFLFVATLLATLPYAAAYLLWASVTLPLYVAAVRAIVGDRIGFLLACAFPAVLSNFLLGQNGFVTAALLGGTLHFLERRPLLAGTFLGLLTYKPQFGLMFPLALLVGRHWRVFLTAGTVGAALAGVSLLAFGHDAWSGFFASLPRASEAILAQGAADWGKLQSVFGLVRTLGGGEMLTWGLQGSTIVASAAAVALLWRPRSGVSFEMRAAGLATAALLSTPYLYVYDLVALAVPVAFLVRAGLTRGLLPYELAGFAAACALIVIFPFVKLPVGLGAVLIVAALIARRTCAENGGASSESAAGTQAS